MKCILLDFRRAITGRWFPAAFFASALTLWLSIGSRTWYLFDMMGYMEAPEWVDLLQSALTGDLALLLLPALSSLPYSAQALRELRSGAFRMAVFRAGRRAYIAGHATVCFVSGMLVQLCAFVLLTGFLTAATVAADGPALPLLALPELAPLLLGRMLCGGGWALIGCSAALLTDTASAAMIGPLCLCYTLTMIATRFFPGAAMLDPLRWQGAPLFILLIAALLMLLGTGAALHREVQKHV